MFHLRTMVNADLDYVRDWRNRPEIRNNMYTNHVISIDEHLHWFESASRDPTKRLLICVDGENVPVGVVTFSNIDARHGTATWAFYSGDTARRGVGSEMELLALDFAFEELKLEKLNCEVLSFNIPVVEFHRKHGFRVEGIFRSHYERDGERHDIYRLAHFRDVWLDKVRPALLRARTSPPLLKAGSEHRSRFKVTHELVRQFANVSGDSNVIHLDDAAARAAGFDGALAQGMLVAAGVSRILGTEFPGKGTVYVSQSLQFLRPVYPNIELEYVLRIVSLIGRRAFVSTKVFDSVGQQVVNGEAEIVVPPQVS